jgi:DNA invertase Pin-like site-specific DNA recombinase
MPSIPVRHGAGRFFLYVMASLAQMESVLTVKRTRTGLEVARKQGRKGMRKRDRQQDRIDQEITA